MSQRCSNCIFARPSVGLSSSKRVCTNNSSHPDCFVIVGIDSRCNNYHVSHLEMMSENPDDKKYKGARLIPLSKGIYTIVDQSDYHWLTQYKWYVEKSGATFYVFSKSTGKNIRMHRKITAAPADLVVDHIDHDGLNNRRSNLRICAIKQNSRNSRSLKGTSKYKGVSWSKLEKRWRASITCNGKKKMIGYYKNETAAARAYDEQARKLFGEYAYLNFPGSG